MDGGKGRDGAGERGKEGKRERGKEENREAVRQGGKEKSDIARTSSSRASATGRRIDGQTD